jgi:Asp-tRNA(Asn)/Glu-tRNA(Gln) amidotransferase A subunit family amidase
MTARTGCENGTPYKMMGLVSLVYPPAFAHAPRVDVVSSGWSSQGLPPLRMMLIGRHFDEDSLYRLGHPYEQELA